MRKKLDYFRYIVLQRWLWNCGGGLADYILSWWHLRVKKLPPIWPDSDSSQCPLRICRFCGRGAIREPKIGGWWFRLTSHKDIMRYERGWRVFVFQLFKWREIPEEGERIQKKHYRGVSIAFAYWLPFESV